jgi:hypothetical protein
LLKNNIIFKLRGTKIAPAYVINPIYLYEQNGNGICDIDPEFALVLQTVFTQFNFDNYNGLLPAGYYNRIFRSNL